MHYSVGEMAQKLKLSPSTLRYYDQQGLIPSVERTPGGARVFTDKDIRWLNLIHCLKKAGMSLKDIRRYIEMTQQGESTLEDRYRMFLEQRQQLQQQLEALQQTMQVVEYKCWYYETALKEGDEAIPREMSLDAMPPQFRAVRQWLRSESD